MFGQYSIMILMNVQAYRKKLGWSGIGLTTFYNGLMIIPSSVYKAVASAPVCLQGSKQAISTSKL